MRSVTTWRATGTGARAVGASRNGGFTLALADGRRLEGDELLVAVGPRPKTDELGLETVGLEPGRPVAVDERLRALDLPGEWLYAVGDTNGRAVVPDRERGLAPATRVLRPVKPQSSVGAR